MDEERVIVKGKRPFPKEEWDAIWRNAPVVDLRGKSQEFLDEMWKNTPNLEDLQGKTLDSCPACKRAFRVNRQRNYCPFCGVKIPLLA